MIRTIDTLDVIKPKQKFKGKGARKDYSGVICHNNDRIAVRNGQGIDLKRPCDWELGTLVRCPGCRTWLVNIVIDSPNGEHMISQFVVVRWYHRGLLRRIRNA